MVEVVSFLTSPTLLAPLVGVLAGELLSMRIDQKLARDREADRRERVRRSMYAELGEIRAEIDAFMESTGAPTIALQTGAYDTAVSSGDFALLGPELQGRLADVYGTADRAAALQVQLQRRWGTDETASLERRFGAAIDDLETAIVDVRSDLA